MIDRRAFLTYTGLVPVIGAVPRLAFAADEITAEKADYTLRIGTGLVELSPDHIVSTTLYNGRFPGPLLRFKKHNELNSVRVAACGNPVVRSTSAARSFADVNALTCPPPPDSQR